MKKKTNKKTTEIWDSTWMETIKNWMIDNAKDLTSGFLNEIQKKVESFVSTLGHSVSRTIFSSLTMFSGLVFMMIGLAILINDLIGISNSIGFIMIGFVVVLVGMFANKNL